MKISIINSHKWAGLAAGMKVQRCGRELFLKEHQNSFTLNTIIWSWLILMLIY